MSLIKEQGIVLRSRDFGEAHKIITLYSLTKGKISLLAKGVKKTKSRLAALCHPFSHGRYLLFAGKSFYTLTQGEIIRSHHQLRDDLWKLAYASYFSELIDLGTEEEEPNEELFQLLLQGFLLLMEEENLFLVTRFFEIRFLAFSGYTPHLEACVSCGKNIEKAKIKFSAKQGGLLCSDCWPQDQYSLNISRETLEIMKRFLRPKGWALRNLRISLQSQKELEKICRLFLRYHLPSSPKSLEFLAALSGVAD